MTLGFDHHKVNNTSAFVSAAIATFAIDTKFTYGFESDVLWEAATRGLGIILYHMRMHALGEW
jgi:hypothetical protein